jgi:REP element-mobilizing transposase RayT
MVALVAWNTWALVNACINEVPGWVPLGAMFHIRIRCAPTNPLTLTDSELAPKLLQSVRFYESRQRWHVRVFLLMPDHLHALFSFPAQDSMASTISHWKAYHARMHRIAWQENFFDHRIRNDEQVGEKARYIRMNPVVKGLCEASDDWRWWLGEEQEQASK